MPFRVNAYGSVLILEMFFAVAICGHTFRVITFCDHLLGLVEFCDRFLRIILIICFLYH